MENNYWEDTGDDGNSTAMEGIFTRTGRIRSHWGLIGLRTSRHPEDL